MQCFCVWLLSGCAEVWNEDKTVQYGVKNEGEFFGELALLTNERRSATVCAGDTALDVFTLLKNDFEKVRKRPKFTHDCTERGDVDALLLFKMCSRIH